MAGMKLPTIYSNDEKIKKDAEVEEMYLAERSLSRVPDLSCFKNLKRIYLNNNKMFHLGNGLKRNFSLTELYLQNNMLTEINSVLCHLTCLRVLFLHSNQLTNLTDVMHELRQMIDLRVLNLFLNPLAQDFNYRDYVIFCIPSLELLDRRGITKFDREKVLKKYDVEREKVKESIAFGTRVDATMKTNNYKNIQPSNYVTVSHEDEFLTKKSSEDANKNIDQLLLERNASLETKFADAIECRAKKRSVMQFKTFSWTDILEQRELHGEQAEKKPIVFSAKFR